MWVEFNTPRRRRPVFIRTHRCHKQSALLITTWQLKKSILDENVFNKAIVLEEKQAPPGIGLLIKRGSDRHCLMCSSGGRARCNRYRSDGMWISTGGSTKSRFPRLHKSIAHRKLRESLANVHTRLWWGNEVDMPKTLMR